MPMRLKIILSSLIGTVVILVIVVVWQAAMFFQKQSVAPVSEGPIIESPIQENGEPVAEDEVEQVGQNGVQQNRGVGQTPTQIPLQSAERQDEITAKLVALTLPFVDRFGTYSNQNNFENLKDVFPYMTDDFKKRSELQIEQVANKPFPKAYTGVVTKALSYKVVSINEQAGTGEFFVTTQRREYIGTPTNFKVYTQDISVTFKKEDSVWLVDSAVWK